MDKEKLLLFKELLESIKNGSLKEDNIKNEILNKYEELIETMDIKEITKIVSLAWLAANRKDDNFEKETESYERIINNLTTLANELCTKNAMEYSNLFTYMLWNGYFSRNHKHAYNMKRANISDHYAFDIFNGGGVCLNYSDMLTDFLNNSGIQASTLSNKISHNASVKGLSGVERNIDKLTIKEYLKLLLMILPIMPFYKFLSNHAVTLTSDFGLLYAYDPTNLSVYNILNSNSMETLNDNGIIKTSPYLSYMVNKNTNYELLDKLITEGQIPNISKELLDAYWKSSWYWNLKVFDSNKQLLEDFHDCIKQDMDTIAATVQKEKQKSIFKR